MGWNDKDVKGPEFPFHLFPFYVHTINVKIYSL